MVFSVFPTSKSLKCQLGQYFAWTFIYFYTIGTEYGTAPAQGFTP